MKRRLIIGDIHGCAGELQDLIDLFNYNPANDELYSVGDVINKGPDTPGVLQLIREHKIQVVRGNHEAHYLNMLERLQKGEKPDDRGKKFFESVGSLNNQDIELIRSWPLWLDLGGIWVVHAGVDPRASHPAHSADDVLLSVRTSDAEGKHLNRPEKDLPWYEVGSWPVEIVFGHWAQNGLVDLPGFKGLDTGCVYGKKLSAWCPEEDRFYAVEAHQDWVKV